MTDRWLQKEVELNHKHEEILERREALLRQAEIRLSDNQDLSASVAHHWHHAKQRNQDLLEDIIQCQTNAKIQATGPPPLNLITLKEKYWDMVENEMPEWKNEVKMTKKDRSNPPSAR